MIEAGDATDLVKKLQGKWYGTAPCQGDVAFDEDGTYSWVHYGPGDVTAVGNWSIRWDALPLTLVMVSTGATHKGRPTVRLTAGQNAPTPKWRRCVMSVPVLLTG